MTFDCFSDPGHGWVKVHLDLIDKLGIADSITMYSFIRGNYVYLEEDLDAGTFITAAEDAGITVKFRHHMSETSSRIRNYDRYCTNS
jgi:hypothetical protein